MKRKLTIMLGGVVAATALTLGMSAEPASAMPKSCLSMHLAYEQANHDALMAFNTLMTFEQNATHYYTPYNESMMKGWFENSQGHIEYYDETEVKWHHDDYVHTMQSDLTYDAAESAYADYLDNCFWS